MCAKRASVYCHTLTRVAGSQSREARVRLPIVRRDRQYVLVDLDRSVLVAGGLVCGGELVERARGLREQLPVHPEQRDPLRELSVFAESAGSLAHRSLGQIVHAVVEVIGSHFSIERNN
ncbi:MAG TPA: hypothetical protein VGQ52_02295 [Gemmatimonadaceae bacterium]|jgi:hypothetical protein|nr:hypothetical protein [Gemmatimonadaceae bacterium]